MRCTDVSSERTRIAFAEAAARHFAANPKHWSYSDAVLDVAPGELLALRWGMGDDCVLVLRIGDDEPVIYGQIIERRVAE